MRSIMRWVRLSLAISLGCAVGVRAQDVGTEGPSFQGAGATPSGSKPESKLWHHDGRWWGVLWDVATADFTIWWLDLDAQTWVNTGVLVDSRSGARGDVLWDGTRLYIASHLVSREDLKYTRPIVVLREEAGEMYVFSASPETGGTIFRKRSALDPIDFDDAPGVAVMRDAEMLRMNDPTCTKQQVTAETGLVVLATNPTANRYWHHHQSLAAVGEVPVASFDADPVAGVAALEVRFTDTSANGPTSWSWEFGDGNSSTLRHPTHLYETPGTYTVALTATNGFGSDTETRADLVPVAVPPAATAFAAVADAQAKSAYPDKNHGALESSLVRFRDGDVSHAYFRFEVAGLAAPPVAARLRLWVADGSRVGGDLYAADSGWDEATLT